MLSGSPVARRAHDPVSGKTTRKESYLLPGGVTIHGYEIHNGITEPASDERSWCIRSADRRAWGTYLHDIFSNDGFRHGWLAAHGWRSSGKTLAEEKASDYDRLADIVRSSLDWDTIRQLMGL